MTAMKIRTAAPTPSQSSSSDAAAHLPALLRQAKMSADPFSRRPRRILVLYVGGTIGMKKNKEGALEPCAGYLTEEMHKMHELKESKEIAAFDIIEYKQLLDSSDMNATDYMRITTGVKEHYHGYDGFLIAHGTDTMHYTASALSFLLYNLAKPVIVTGAMVPLAEPYNDARRNIIISMMIASNPKICEVCIFFNDRLFRGNRCDKVRHTYAAFESPNYPALGIMEATTFVLKERYVLPQPTGAMAVLSDLRGTVMVFDMQPDADVEAVLAVLNARRPLLAASGGDGPECTKRNAHQSQLEQPAARGESGVAMDRPLLDGIVLILRGIGSVDGIAANALRRVAAATVKHRIVAVVTQPEIQGVLSGAELARLHLIAPTLVYTGDMTTAAAEIKLLYLFGKGLDPLAVASYMGRNLRGELTPSTPSSAL